MKKATIIIALLLASLIGFSQNKTAKGKVLDISNKSVIPNAVIQVNDTSLYTLTNEKGQFSIEIPKSFHKLSVQHEEFLQKEIILKPGFQLKPMTIYLQSKKYNELVKKGEKIRDSIYKTRKNTLSLSVLELFNVTLGVCYERIFLENHSLGAYLSIYFYGRNIAAFGSEYDYYPHYQGFKFAPDYRFYPIKNKRTLFIEGKLQVGYIHFSELPYHYYNYTHLYQDIQYSFWTAGFGASAGVKFHTNKAILTLIAGYQYFPIHVPETIERVLHDNTLSTLTTDTSFWYMGGPGSQFVFKFLIGGVF